MKYTTKAQKTEDGCPCHPMPDEMEPNVIYESGSFAVLKCPCGCDTVMCLPLTKEFNRPVWSLTGAYDAPTLRPSVLQMKGCKSHFFITDGEVQWC